MTLAVVAKFADGICLLCDSRKTILDTGKTFDNSEKLHQINLNTGIVTAGLAYLGVNLIETLKTEAKDINLYSDIEKLAQNIFSKGYATYIKTKKQGPLHYLMAGYNGDDNKYEITGYFSPLFKPIKWKDESIFIIGSNDKMRKTVIRWYKNLLDFLRSSSKSNNISIRIKGMALMSALNQVIDKQLNRGIGGPIQIAYITKQGFRWSNYAIATKGKNISAYRNKTGWKIVDHITKTEKNIPTLDFQDIGGILISKI